MELKLYFRMLQKNWWLVLLTAMVALAVSLAVSYAATPQFRASARFIIVPSSALERGTDVVRSLETLDRRSVVATYAEVMDSQKILLVAQQSLQIPPEMLNDYSTRTVVLPDANVLELTATGPNPKIAAHLVNTMGYQSIQYSRQLNMSFELNFLDEAVVPEKPFSPEPLRDAGIALVLGLLSGGVLAILSEQISIPLESYRQRLRIDNVTGVYNNRYFRELLEEELKRNPEDMLSVGIIELRGLQELAESLPISGLQSLLHETTRILQQELRGHDIVGRWNDTSFVVMLPTTPAIAAKRTFDRISQALSREVALKGYDITISLRPLIGGAVYSNLLTSRELITKAIDSLEQANTSADTPVYLWTMNSPFWVEK